MARKQLKGWISATTLQLPAKAEEASLSGGLEHRGLQCAVTCSAEVDGKKYWITMNEEMEIASGTGNLGKPFRFIRGFKWGLQIRIRSR